MTTGHSKVGASSMYRWSNCPGSVRLSAGIESKSSVYAEEGTKAHDLAAKMLDNHGNTDGAFDPDNAEMLEAVQVYVDAVRATTSPSDTLLVEQGFHLKQIHESCYGTADAVVWKPYSRHLHVFDYKHGAGIPVEVKGNPQLRYYALGALLQSGFNAREITVHIVQPRCHHPDGPVRSETFDAFDLIEWSADLLEAVQRTEAPDAPLNPGDHCKFCPAAALCPALHERANAVARLQFSAAVPYDAAKLKLALDSRDALKAFIKALDEFAYAEAMAGRLPESVGYKLVEKRANRSWKDEAAVAKALEQKYTDDTMRKFYDPATLKSPPQVEKVIGKKAFAEIEKEFVEKKSSGFTLAPVDDPRSPIRILDAAAEFASAPVVTEVTA
jgi:hypothetical protein